MGAAQFARHQSLAGAVKRIALAAGCEATLEPAAFNRFCPSKASKQRPGDVTICPVDDLGTVIAVDVTVRGRHMLAMVQREC